MSIATPNSIQGVDVWKRVWDRLPSEEKDRRRLEIELRSPRWQGIVAALNSRFGSIEGLRVVELGSGRGDLSALLAMEGANVTLVDIFPDVLEQARVRFGSLGLNAEYVVGDLLDIRRSVEPSYDVSLSSGVVEHFTGKERLVTIASHRDVLRRGGMGIISVPHSRCIPYRIWKAYLELRGWWPYGLEIPYSGRELRKLALEGGFSHAETRSTSFLESVGEHWWRRWFGNRPDWMYRSCALDRIMGQVITLYAWADV